MAKKEVKQIRVVYFPGDNTSEYYDHKRERLEMQEYDAESKKWEMITSLPFTLSTEWNTTIDPCFLHYSMLHKVCDYCYNGYTLLGWFNVNNLDD